MNPEQVKIEESWRKVLWDEFTKDYFDSIKVELVSARESGKIIYPPGSLIFNAFEMTPFDTVKVVIIGQDPYHNPGEAMGLCFSVPRQKRIPPSLVNIYKEINQDLGLPIPTHGDLSKWARQGVLLLNSFLTVEKNKAASHRNIGWQYFTDAVIKEISDRKEGIIFLLWGRFAQSKAPLISHLKHHILTAAHPSPLARNAFSGCAHFSKTNSLLEQMNRSAIDWTID